MTKAEKEVLELVKLWNDCFTQNEAENYFTFIHGDLTLFIPSNPYRIDGKQDDKEEFEWSLSKSRTKVHFFQELQPQVTIQLLLPIIHVALMAQMKMNKSFI